MADEGKAVIEADFYGKQNFEFAGVKPCGKEVQLPLCVKYDVKNGKITREYLNMCLVTKYL